MVTSSAVISDSNFAISGFGFWPALLKGFKFFLACAISFSIAAICSRIFAVPFSASINSKLSVWKCRTAQPEREPPADCERPTFNDYSPETFAACKPLGPLVTSNSTACPSFKDLYPSP
jgi:hypothetical protein